MKFTLKLTLAILIVASVACTMYAYSAMEDEVFDCNKILEP